MTVCRPPIASDQEITRFHSSDYISFLQSVTPHTMTKFTKADSFYSVGTDCPLFPGLWDFCCSCCKDQLRGLSSGYQLVWRTPPCKEG